MLIGLLVFLLIISACLSASETSLISLNVYRLKHLAKTDKKANLILELLKRPDRLLGLILIINTFAGVAASSITTLIFVELFGDELGLWINTFALTFIMLIFTELLPKTLGALKAKGIAMLVARPLRIILYILFPLVWLVNMISNGILSAFGVKVVKKHESLSIEELRTVLTESTGLLDDKYKAMLSNILELEKLKVEDIMTPRNDILGLDLNLDTKALINSLSQNGHTLLPVYHGELENIIGLLRARDLAKIWGEDLDANKLEAYLQKPYFVPEGTSLYKQLINFQQNKQQMALVLDEYGDILGLLTIADILEEIVGEFTSNILLDSQELQLQADNSYLVGGSLSIRSLNRSMNWQLPSLANTLSGLIIEHLGLIPELHEILRIANYELEVMSIQDNTIKLVKLRVLD